MYVYTVPDHCTMYQCPHLVHSIQQLSIHHCDIVRVFRDGIDHGDQGGEVVSHVE